MAEILPSCVKRPPQESARSCAFFFFFFKSARRSPLPHLPTGLWPAPGAGVAGWGRGGRSGAAAGADPEPAAPAVLAQVSTGLTRAGPRRLVKGLGARARGFRKRDSGGYLSIAETPG